jgi:hypothetical protein
MTHQTTLAGPLVAPKAKSLERCTACGMLEKDVVGGLCGDCRGCA